MHCEQAAGEAPAAASECPAGRGALGIEGCTSAAGGAWEFRYVSMWLGGRRYLTTGCGPAWAESCASDSVSHRSRAGDQSPAGPRAPRAERRSGCLAERRLGPSRGARICLCLDVFTGVLVTNSSVFRGDYLAPKLTAPPTLVWQPGICAGAGVRRHGPRRERPREASPRQPRPRQPRPRQPRPLAAPPRPQGPAPPPGPSRLTAAVRLCLCPVSPSCSGASLTLVWRLWQTDLQGALEHPPGVIPSS